MFSFADVAWLADAFCSSRSMPTPSEAPGQPLGRGGGLPKRLFSHGGMPVLPPGGDVFVAAGGMPRKAAEMTPKKLGRSFCRKERQKCRA